jgi:hypothetical protein
MVQQPINKQQLDSYFTSAYTEIEKFGLHSIKLNKRNIDVPTVMNECYLYLLDKINDLYTSRDVVAFSKTWIKNNLLWYNSPLLRQELPRYGQLEIIDDLTYDVDGIGATVEKINEITEKFYSLLSSYDKGLFQIYFKLDLRKGKDIAEYLNVSLSGAYLVKNECKELETKYRNYLLKNLIL